MQHAKSDSRPRSAEYSWSMDIHFGLHAISSIRTMHPKRPADSSHMQQSAGGAVTVLRQPSHTKRLQAS